MERPNPLPSPKTRRKWALYFALALTAVLFLAVVVLPQPDRTLVPAHLMLAPGANAWDAGRTAYDSGEFEDAIAYWKQVSPDDPQYARSLRYLGWEIYAKELDQPRKALTYVHRSVLAEPLDSNTWQDLGRTYANLFGL